MRVIRDGVGDVTGPDQVWVNVRYQVDDQKRVAVYGSTKTVGPPVAVYAEGEASYVLKRKPCSCKGDASRMRLTQAWMSADKVNA